MSTAIEDFNTPVTQDNVHRELPFQVEWIAQYIQDYQHLGLSEALRAIYMSEMYSRLEEASTALWMAGPVCLYEQLCDEKGWPRPAKRVERWPRRTGVIK